MVGFACNGRLMTSLLKPSGRIAPLTEEELSRLDVLLAACPGGRSLSLVQADGLLAALAAGPTQSGPAEYWPVIFGRPVDSTLLREMPHVDEAMLLLARHWNSMCDTLAAGALLGPLLVQSPKGPCGFALWARGFVGGVRMHHDLWLPLLEDTQHGPLLAPVYSLANDDASARSGPVGLREADLLDDITLALAQVYRFFRQPQATGAEGAPSRFVPSDRERRGTARA
jgi:yecA family protein